MSTTYILSFLYFSLFSVLVFLYFSLFSVLVFFILFTIQCFSFFLYFSIFSVLVFVLFSVPLYTQNVLINIREIVVS